MVNEFKKVVWAGVMMLALFGLVARPVGAQETESTRKITRRVTPAYPTFAQQARLTGTVRMLLIVNADGSVKSVRTLGGNAVLASAAEIAMKQWKFEPLKSETNESIAFHFEAPK